MACLLKEGSDRVSKRLFIPFTEGTLTYCNVQCDLCSYLSSEAYLLLFFFFRFFLCTLCAFKQTPKQSSVGYPLWSNINRETKCLYIHGEIFVLPFASCNHGVIFLPTYIWKLSLSPMWSESRHKCWAHHLPPSVNKDSIQNSWKRIFSMMM